jgi:hypothetical protein
VGVIERDYDSRSLLDGSRDLNIDHLLGRVKLDLALEIDDKLLKVEIVSHQLLLYLARIELR